MSPRATFGIAATFLIGAVSVLAFAATLVIHSRDDTAVTADEGRLLASTVPGAELVLLPSGAHYFPTDAEIATLAARAITRFLSQRR